MPFLYPATELFRAEDRRVVWSIEEYEAALVDGWSEEKPARVPPTISEVLAAGYAQERAEVIVANEKRKFAAGIKPYGPHEDDAAPLLVPVTTAPPAPKPGKK